MNSPQRGLATLRRAYTERYDQRQVEEPPQHVCPQVHLQGGPEDRDGVPEGEGCHLEVPAGIQIIGNKHPRYFIDIFRKCRLQKVTCPQGKWAVLTLFETKTTRIQL